MADKNWQAGGKILIPAQAAMCLIGVLVPFGAAWAISDKFAPTSYIGSADPNVVWEAVIGGVVVCGFLAAVTLWILSALRKAASAACSSSASGAGARQEITLGSKKAKGKSWAMVCTSCGKAKVTGPHCAGSVNTRIARGNALSNCAG